MTFLEVWLVQDTNPWLIITMSVREVLFFFGNQSIVSDSESLFSRFLHFLLISVWYQYALMPVILYLVNIKKS